MAKNRTHFIDWIYRNILSPPPDAGMSPLVSKHDSLIPTLWLLGKTGAGKSSIVQKLTAESSVEIGNGFEPCTRTATVYNYPPDKPVVRFLDTRGLAEVSYDPLPDLIEAQRASHLLVAVMRVDDAEQSALVDAIRKVLSADSAISVLVVHTALHEIADKQKKQRAMEFNQQAIETCAKRTLRSVAVDFTPIEDGIEPHDYGIDQLQLAIVDAMPELHLLHHNRQQVDEEQQSFERVRQEVFWYAGVAAASDALPAVGLVTVPGIQGKMLHSLAQRYGVSWTKRNAAELLGALGSTLLYRYALSLGGRQLAKLIPFYGQSVGATAAASISFASTFALGRAAGKYLFSKSNNLPLDPEQIRDSYREVMRSTPGRSAK